MFSWFSQWNKFGNRWIIDEVTAYKKFASFWTTLCSAEEWISHRWCNALLSRRPGMSLLTFCLVIVLSNLGLFPKCFQKEKQSKADKSLNVYQLCNNDITKPRNGITHSHGSARVFWRRRGKSMEKAKIRPLATPKPLNRSSQKLAGVIMSWTAPGIRNFVAISSGVSVPQIRDFAVLLGWL